MKNTFIAATCASVAFISTPSFAELDRIRWQIPMPISSSLAILGDTMTDVSRRLEEISDGRIRLQVFEPNSLIPALGVFENVSTGTIDAGFSWMGYESGQVPASALFGATPFGLESNEFTAWLYFHGGDGLLKALYEPHNVYPISCGTVSSEAAGWFREEVKTPEDMKGIKFRAAGLGGEIMAEMGMSVTMLPGGELYQALETGVIDGTEFSIPTVDQQLGFYQVAKHYYLPGWHQPSTNLFLYINLDSWKDLSPSTQTLIETTCMAANTYSIAKSEAMQGAVINDFESKGVQLHQYSPEILKAFEKATETVMARRSASNKEFAEIYASMKAFQEEHSAWKNYGYLPRDWHQN